MEGSELAVTLHPYPVEGWLEVDVSGFPEGRVPERIVASLWQSGQEVVSAEAEPTPRLIHATDGQGDTPKHTPSGDPLPTRASQARARLPILKLPAGSYDLRVSAHDAAGAVLGRQETRFEMPPPPYWLSDQEGREPELPLGFPPVKAEGPVVRAWGREYHFGGGPLLSYVSCRGADLLASPIEMRARWSGGQAPFTGLPAELRRVEPARADLHGIAEAGPFRMEGDLGVEFDGMIRADLTISGPARVVLETLTLDIPLKAEHARYLYHFPGQWGSTANAGALPAEGWSHDFKPLVWLGDEDRGFCWFAETDEEWRPTGNDQAIQVVPQGETVVLRLNIIAAPISLDKPLRLTFGYQATPVKEITEDVWDFRIAHEWNYGIESAPLDGQAPEERQSAAKTKLDRLAELGVRTIAFHEYWTDIQNYTSTTHGEDLHRLVKGCHQRGMRLLLYFGYLLSDLAPEYRHYADECLVVPNPGGYAREPEQLAYVVCYGSHWADFIASGIARVMDEYEVDGVYLDGVHDPWMGGCSNPHHGCGYDAEDGTRRVTWPFFAVRRLMHRVWNIVKSRKPDGLLNIHNSTEMIVPTLAFATSSWDGEQLGSIDAGPDVLSLIPLEAFRAEFMGRQWGVPAEFLCYGRPYTYEQALSFTLLHDVLARGLDLSSLELESALWHAMDEFGRKQAEWLPYWSNQCMVQVTPETYKASLYNRGPLGAMLIVSNLGRAEVEPAGGGLEATVTLNRAGLGLPEHSAARDALSGKQLPWDGSTLRCSLPSLSFRVVKVAPEGASGALGRRQ